MENNKNTTCVIKYTSPHEILTTNPLGKSTSWVRTTEDYPFAHGDEPKKRECYEDTNAGYSALPIISIK